MSENLEQNSQSESTAPTEVPEAVKYQVEIEPLLQPHRAVLSIEHKDLRARFNDFFHVHEDKMVAHFKVKGQKAKNGKVRRAQKILESNLGVNNMYVDVMHQLLYEQITDIFFLEGFRLTDFEDKDKPKASIVAKFFYAPDLELVGDINYECENPVRQPEADAWADRCRELQHKHKYNEEYTDTSLDVDNLEVLIDLIVSDDKYTLRRKWIELAHLPQALQTEVKAHVVGDLFETKYQAHDLTESKAKELDAHVKIYEARKLVRPEIDDELAKKEEFESVDQLKAQFQVDFDEYTERAKSGVAFNHVVNAIIAVCKLPHIPDMMIAREMQQRLDEHLQRCRGDKKMAMAVLGVSKPEDMETQFRARVIQEILSGLAARKYAQIHDLPVKENILVDHMLNQVEWVERKEEKTDES